MNKLYILCGIPFSGKTFLAKTIEKRLGYIRIDLDDIKFELFGKGILDENLKQKDWDAIYRKMYRRIENSLKKGNSVIHDTGNFTKDERDLVRKIGNKLGVETTTIFIDIPKETAYKRLSDNRKTRDRFDVSDSGFKKSVKEMEIPTKGEKVIIFRHNDSVDKWIDRNFL